MDAEYKKQIEALVVRYKEAEGLLMKLAIYAGSQIEGLLSQLPDGFEAQVQSVVKAASDTAYEASGTISASSLAPATPSYFHKIAVIFSGAIGGVDAGGDFDNNPRGLCLNIYGLFAFTIIFDGTSRAILDL